MHQEGMKGHIAALLTILIWSSTLVSIKILLQSFSTLELLISRFVMTYVILFLIYPKPLKLPWKEEVAFALAGLTGITIYYIFEASALVYTQASNVSVIVSTAPFVTAILAHFILKERLSKNFFLGFLLSFIGLVFIIFNGQVALKLSPKGDLLALCAVFSWACYSVIISKIFKSKRSIIQTTRRIFLYGIFWTIPFTQLMDFHLSLSKFMNWTVMLNFMYLVLAASCFGFLIWNYSIVKIGVVTTNLYLYLIPVFATIMAVIFLNEKITLLSIFGTGCVLGGLVISQWKSIKMGLEGRRKNDKNILPRT